MRGGIDGGAVRAIQSIGGIIKHGHFASRILTIDPFLQPRAIVIDSGGTSSLRFAGGRRNGGSDSDISSRTLTASDATRVLIYS